MIYDFSTITSKGADYPLSQHKGQVLLIVNTASKCGFTPQFAELEQLYQQYKDQGLVILGFPCNQFAGQEPGSGSDAEAACQLNYGVTFPIMQKIKVNGSDADPIFKYLKSQAGGFITDTIKWNFTKFLISRDGTEIRRYAPITKPSKIAKDIEAMLVQS